jgi:hypothetical protein
MKAMAAGDVEVLFFAAAWDLCELKIIGATINFPSLSLQREGQDIIAKNGIYSEDVCILPSKIDLGSNKSPPKPEGRMCSSVSLC